MSEKSRGEDYLRKKYNLHKTSEVLSAAQRTEVRTGEELDKDPDKRIQNYLDRFKEIIERKDPSKRERGIEAIKRILYKEYVIKKENIPQSYWDLQGKIAVNEGRQAELEQSGVVIEKTKNIL